MLIGAEQRRQLRPQGNARGTRERREIDDQVGLLDIGERQRVAEHEPALGIGVADFDAQALARREHVAGPIGVAADRILDRRNQHAKLDANSGGHQQVREPERNGRPTHVLLHERHAGARLDIEAAGIEAHALADQRRGAAPARGARRGGAQRDLDAARGAAALARPTA